MPKFLAGCHYNEPLQINGNKFATGHILRKPVEVVKGRILAGWAQKSPEPCAKEKSSSKEFNRRFGNNESTQPLHCLMY